MKLISIIIGCLLMQCSFSQNVGIGTTTPQKKLHIISDDSISMQLQSSNLNSELSAVGITLKPNNITSFSLIGVGKSSSIFTNDTGRLHLYRHAGTRKELVWSVDGKGRIGIGPGEILYPNRLVVGQLNIDNMNGTTGLLINNIGNVSNFDDMEDAITLLRNNSYGFNIKVGKPLISTGSGADFGVYDPANPFGFTTKFQIYNQLTKSLNNFYANKNLYVNEDLSVTGSASVSGRLSTGLSRPFVDVNVPANTILEIFCNCPSNTDVIGGGGGHRDYNNAAQDIVINYSGPDIGGQTFRWRVVLTNRNPTDARAARVYAVCSRIQ